MSIMWIPCVENLPKFCIHIMYVHKSFVQNINVSCIKNWHKMHAAVKEKLDVITRNEKRINE